MSSLDNPILDYVTTTGADNHVINLDTVFSGSGLTYTISSSNEDIASVALDGSKLTIDYTDALGYTDLKITATDATGHMVKEDVRVRVAGEHAYTIAVMPDTQDYTNAAGVATFEKMSQWLVDNKDSLGIQFVTHVGDITTENSDVHWAYAKQALSILDGKIPYGLTLGNHDGVSGSFYSSNINKYFSVDQLKAANGEHFGGTYDQQEELSNNSYSTFTAPDGTKWLVLNIEFGARQDVLRWAGDVIEANLDHRVILTTHSYMNWAGRHDATGKPLYDEGTGPDYGLGNSLEGATDGETMYRELVQKYPNVSFTFSGHIFGDGAETLVSYDQYGNPVHQMMVNYQNGVAGEITSNDGEGSGGAGGNGAIRLLTIDPENGTVYTSTYFAGLDSYSDSARGDGELDRNGLTGPYRGHEETLTGLDLGTPKIVPVAQAGNDQFIETEGAGKAEVMLDASRTLNSGNDDGMTYVWTDADGQIIAEGEKPTVALSAGHHKLTLTVTDSNGVSSTDTIRTVISNDNTLLTDNFNDGDANGWGSFAPPVDTSQGSTASYGIESLQDETDATNISFVPKLANSQGLLIDFEGAAAGTILKTYTLAFDILVPKETAGTWTALYQTNLSNTDDGDFFIKNAGNGTGGIGISSTYTGTFQYDTWQRVVIKIEANGAMSKYIDGTKVGTQNVDVSRYQIDLDKGLLLFSDENGESSPVYSANVLLTDKLYTDAEIKSLGGASAGGIVSEKPSTNSFQFNLGSDGMKDVWSESSITAGEINTAASSFIVKGSVHSLKDDAQIQDAAEGRVWEQSDSAGKVFTWNAAAALNWSNYEFEATLQATDNDSIGVVFYYQNPENHYKFVLDAETNTRALIKVENGQETVLARENGGTPWSRDFQIKVVIEGNDIKAFIDDHDVFGTITDVAALPGGTIGFLSVNQRSSQFDNVTVNKVGLSAHAGDNLRLVDVDGDGSVTAKLDASGSYGTTENTSFVWSDLNGNVVATGQTAEVALDVGKQNLTLTVTDADGTVAMDRVAVNAVSQDQLLLSEDFSGETLNGWRIVDEGEFGGVGADGKSSQWELQNQTLSQLSDLKSRELTWTGSATNADPWKIGWSPLGDGVNVLRKGTYALYDDPKALEWNDYAVEATIQTADNGALGLLFYYQDANNYYKLELDANGDYDRSPSNGAGSLFQLIQVKDGVEKFLTQFPAKYTPNNAFDIRVEVLDGKIQAFVDGMELFAYAIEDHAQTKGTIGLFSWDSAGVSFDDVRVISLTDRPDIAGKEIKGNNQDNDLTGTAGNDTMIGRGGDDLLTGLAGDDIIDGGDGDDILIGGTGSDQLKGGTGDDVLDGGVGNDTAYYADGRSAIHVDLSTGEGSGHDIGYDELIGIENIAGTKRNDTLTGDDGANDLRGAGGNDLIDGGRGNDTLDGGSKNDKLSGGSGDDLIIAGAGNDIIDGNDGFDILDVSEATGTVTVDFTKGRISGEGIGRDKFVNIEKILFGMTNDIVKGGKGDDAIDGGDGDDKLTGGSGDDAIWGGLGRDRLDGGSGDDELSGDNGDDNLRGGSGDDLLNAGAGNDKLNGGSGDDRMTGGKGNDALTGGSGVDTFIFAAGFGQDTITDFRPSGYGQDVLEFSKAIFDRFEDIMLAATQIDTDVIIEIGKDSLQLNGVQLTDLSEEDFTFI